MTGRHANVAFFVPHLGCPNRCSFCNQKTISGQQRPPSPEEVRRTCREALERLGEREKHILALRFYEGKTQMEVSAEVGISQAQVSRLEKGAINTIKKNI